MGSGAVMGAALAAQEDAAERAAELAGNPGVLLGLAAGLTVFGALMLPLRAAIVRASVEPAVPARDAFRWLDLVAVLLAFVLAQTVAMFAAVLSIHGSWPEDGAALDRVYEQLTFMDTMAIQGISFLAACAVVVGVALRRGGGVEALGLGRPARARYPLGRHVVAFSSYLLGLPFLFAAGVATGAVFAFQGLEMPKQDVAVAIQEHIDSQPVLVVTFAVLLIPLFEEILFRGFLLELLVAKLGRLAGVVLSSAAFAVAHGLVAAPTIFVLAVVLAAVKLRTRSLLPVWILHGTHNGLTLLAQARGLVD